MGRKIERAQVDHENEQTNLQWRYNGTEIEFQYFSYDYNIVSVPFSIVEKWRLPYSLLTMSNAINNMPSKPRVRLLYNSRLVSRSNKRTLLFAGSQLSRAFQVSAGSVTQATTLINGTGPASVIGSYPRVRPWHRVRATMDLRE
jgi:hypothetical protein